MGLKGEQKKILADLKEQAEFQAQVNSGIKGYLDALEKVRKTNEAIKIAKQQEAKIQAAMDAAAAAMDAEEALKQYEILQLLKKQRVELEKQNKVFADIVREAKVMKMTLAEAGVATGKGLAKTLGNLPGIIKNSTSRLKDLFEMDKSIKMSALQMGILSKQSTSFRDTIKDAAMDTNAFGVGVQELAEMQASYSENLGRTVVLSKQGLESMAAMAKATGLGADGAAEMAAALDSQGLSANRTKDFIEQTMNDSHQMGLNATKVVKNLQQNIKMLNKYSFRNGTKGLAKMAETATKLGVDMESVGAMSEKLFNIDGAVEMSAQLQVMGGAWAKMSDPFKLMYMAREDPNALLQQTAEAAAESFHYANGEFTISALEIQKLKQVAKNTGQEYDKLAEAGKNAAKFAFVRKQISFGFDKETKAFIENTAVLEDGKATIMIDGKPKLVSQLTKADERALEALKKEKASLEERAKQSQTFDDKLSNLINMVKTSFLPIVEGINEVLSPLVNDLMGEKGNAFREDLKNLGKDIGHFVMKGAEFIKGIAEVALMLGPKGIFYTILGAKGLGVLFDVAKWFVNGLSLAKGFQAGTGGLGNAIGSLGKGIAKVGGYVGLAVSAIQIGADAVKNANDPNLSGWDAFKKTIWDNKGKLIGGAIGGLAAGLGSFGVGTVAGAGIGASIGGQFDTPSNDGFFGAPMHDGMSYGGMATGGILGGMTGGPLGAMLGQYLGSKYGSDFSEGRGILQSGKIHPIDNKDDLLAMKKGGVIDKAGQNANSTLKVDFSEIKINGSIMVETPGNPGHGVDLIKDQGFIRSLTQLIHQETRRQIGKA